MGEESKKIISELTEAVQELTRTIMMKQFTQSNYSSGYGGDCKHEYAPGASDPICIKCGSNQRGGGC